MTDFGGDLRGVGDEGKGVGYLPEIGLDFILPFDSSYTVHEYIIYNATQVMLGAIVGTNELVSSLLFNDVKLNGKQTHNSSIRTSGISGTHWKYITPYVLDTHIPYETLDGFETTVFSSVFQGEGDGGEVYVRESW